MSRGAAHTTLQDGSSKTMPFYFWTKVKKTCVEDAFPSIQALKVSVSEIIIILPLHISTLLLLKCNLIHAFLSSLTRGPPPRHIGASATGASVS